jgi:hypothetical protein
MEIVVEHVGGLDVHKASVTALRSARKEGTDPTERGVLFRFRHDQRCRRLLRRLGWTDRLSTQKTGYLQAKRKATTGIEPVFTALQRAEFRSSELFAGVFSSVRCSEFCSVL